MKRIISIYTVVSVAFALGICAIFLLGQPMSHGLATAHASTTGSIWSALEQNLKEPLAGLLIQFIVIIAATRLVGSLSTRFGQPAVIGEMLAGILLGPSLLGWLSPETFAFVFPKPSMGILQLFS